MDWSGRVLKLNYSKSCSRCQDCSLPSWTIFSLSYTICLLLKAWRQSWRTTQPHQMLPIEPHKSSVCYLQCVKEDARQPDSQKQIERTAACASHSELHPSGQVTFPLLSASASAASGRDKYCKSGCHVNIAKAQQHCFWTWQDAQDNFCIV